MIQSSGKYMFTSFFRVQQRKMMEIVGTDGSFSKLLLPEIGYVTLWYRNELIHAHISDIQKPYLPVSLRDDHLLLQYN